jgi:hypothetical protein
MRHEAGVMLESHPIRNNIPTEPWAVTHQVDDVAALLSEEAMADFDILEADFQWPRHWTRARKALMMYACQSEFQLVAYLHGLLEAEKTGQLAIPAGFRDKKVDWVAGIRIGGRDAVSRA